VVENPDGVCRGIVAVTVDGVKMAGGGLGLKMYDDCAIHRVTVLLGVTVNQ
jgi:hypothetical protein